MTKRLLCILVSAAGLGLSQPQKGYWANIELTVYAVNGMARDQPNAPAEELPDDLGSTFKQLRTVLMYKSYKLVDTFTLRGRANGGAHIGGEYPGFNYGQYDFRYGIASVERETPPRVVHISGLRLEITRRPPGPITQGGAPPITVALVATDLDLREGQKTVVGKSAVNGTDALILVIVPKVID